MSSIRISPKHGVNPTIPVCFFCGHEKNELALLGQLKGDVEAPKNAILDYEPCESCQKIFAQGILLVGVSDHINDGRPPIVSNGSNALYPTGSYMVVTEDFLDKTFDEETATGLRQSRKAVVDDEALKMLQERYEAMDETKDDTTAE